MTVEYPPREEIRSLCTEQSFQRGINYYRQDRIVELEVDGREIRATVRGSSDYDVSIDVENDAIRTACSCPYSYAGDCKHIVAVLLAVEDREVETTDEAASASDGQRSGTTDIEALLEQTPADELRTFLLEIIADDRDLRDRFVAFAGEEPGKTVYDYKSEIDRLFSDAAGRGGWIEYGTWIDFSQYHDLAETHRDRGRVGTATDIYRTLAEAIRENLDRVDDSSGHYGRELERAVEAYAETIAEQDLDHEQKRPYIEYLVEECIEADYDFVSSDYENALGTLCTTSADLEYWLELLDDRVSDVSLDPAVLKERSTAGDETAARGDAEPGTESTADDSPADDTVPEDDATPESASERGDDVLYASDFTDGPLTTDDFTGDTLDVQHLAVGPLELGYFVGDAFEELRVDDPTTVEEHTAEVEQTGSSSSESEIASSFRKRGLLSTYIDLLEKLGEEDALSALYEDIYLENSHFCKQYAERLIEQDEHERAIEVVEDGLETFGSKAGLRWLAADCYRDRQPEQYRESLERLFLDHTKWEAYDELKDVCDDRQWESIYETFEQELADDQQRLINLYVHEGDLEAAFAEVIDSEKLSWLRRYRDPVARVDPDEYFETYRELLVPFAAGDTGRRHYRTIADHLEELQELVSADRFEEFVDFLKEEHSNRPAFLDELEKAGF